MIPYFPKQISYRAVSVFFLALAFTSVFYFDYSMSWGYITLGTMWVFGFFMLSSYFSKGWRVVDDKGFTRDLFLLAFGLRIVWVIASYFFYIHTNGNPFEFGAADSMGYHGEAEWLASEPWSTAWDYYFGPGSYGISDVGYPLYLTLLYKIIGPSIIVPRFIKAILSAFTCVLIYRLASRTFGEHVGRMAGIMAALMPNLIIYCGYHLKETEMLFLEVAFLERLDYLIRNKKVSFWNILLPTLLALSLFFFRTVLGAAALFAFATSVILSSTPTMKKGWRRTALIAWGVLGLVVIGGGRAATEIEGLWEEKDSNVENKRIGQTSRGNQWAQYATGSVMAPMAFVLPFATMVDVDQQYGQQEKSGGNYIRNFMGFFAFIAVYEAFRRKKWRDFALIGSFVIAYLGVVSLSGYSNSERFLLPGLPCLIMMWAYGLSALRERTYQLLTPWCVIVFLMEFGWAYFKLGSRGLF